jgi:hypothetical protein
MAAHEQGRGRPGRRRREGGRRGGVRRPRGAPPPRAARALPRPAAACYLRAPGDSVHRAFKLDVLRVEDGAIAEITTFNSDLFAAFGLDDTL